MNVLKEWARRRHARGQALLEFALSLPVILVIMMGVVGFAFILFSWITLYHAANEGASYALRNPVAGDTASERVQEVTDIIENGVTPNMLALYAEGSVSCTETQSSSEWTCIYTQTSDTTVTLSIPANQVALTINYRVPLPIIEVPMILSDEDVTVMAPLPIRATGAGYYD